MGDFSDNASAHRFEWTAPEGRSFATYRDAGGVRAILHVETPPNARGLGHAARLMDAIVTHARTNGVKLQARCPYAVAYLARHPEAGDVIS